MVVSPSKWLKNLHGENKWWRVTWLNHQPGKICEPSNWILSPLFGLKIRNKILELPLPKVVFTASGDDPPRCPTSRQPTAPWPIFPVLQAPTEWLDWLYFLEFQVVVGFCWVANKTMVASSSYCWWKQSCHQLIGSSLVHPIIYRVFYIPGGCLEFPPSTVTWQPILFGFFHF